MMRALLRSIPWLFLVALFGLAGPAPAIAVESVAIAVNKARVFQLPRTAKTVFVANPAIADVQAPSASIIYVFGKKTGSTTLVALDESDQLILERTIDVTHDLESLQAAMAEVDPDGRILTRSIEGGIVLSGTVSDPAAVAQVRETTRKFLGEGETIVDRMQVKAATQVNIRVRVVEVSRDVSKIFGINWDSVLSAGDFVFGLTNGREFLSDTGTVSRLAATSGTAGSILGGYNGSRANLNALIDALERDGLVTLLAEPNLTALTGETASFLAGGEYPIPVSQNNGEIQVQFKEFGVKLAFTPTVLSGERISLRVKPEVSELTDQGSVQVSGITIPALSTRKADTTVELGSGQSFSIGGLIRSTSSNAIEKFPGLGDLPILGTLFRSTSFQREETELVILVTPYLVRPVDQSLATPLDRLRQPTDGERIVDQMIAVPETAAGRAPSSALRNPSGFMLP